MNRPTAVLGSLIMLCLAAPGFGAEPASAPAADSGFHLDKDLQWKEAAALPAGVKVAVLEGDPSKEGMFVMRIRLPDGLHIPPHTHPKTERITILSGTFHLAMGENLTRSAARALPVGSYGFWPAGMKHTGWAQGETTLQLHGTGPWGITYVNPADDPRNKK